MNEYEDFARCVEKFFMEYLVKERGTSHHTIRSYRDTLVLFITYMQDKEHVKAENLSFYHINRKTVIGFLNWLQDDAGVPQAPEIKDMRQSVLFSGS